MTNPKHNVSFKRGLLLASVSGMLLLAAWLAGCQAAPTMDAKTFAQKLMQDAGKGSTKITNVVSGDKKYKQADEVWCIATDATSADGQIPYLLAVWRKGDKWDGTELEEGYYAWDLYGCPR